MASRWNNKQVRIRIPHCEKNYGPPDSGAARDMAPVPHAGKVAILRQYGELLDHGMQPNGRVSVRWIPSEDSKDQGLAAVTCLASSYHIAVNALHRHVTAMWCRVAGSDASTLGRHGEA